jgi:hypothetical protein
VVTFDGKTDDDRALWRTYLHWGREQLRPGATGAMVDDPSKRISETESRALQAVLFSAFALEFRLKRVLTFLNASLKPDEGLKNLLKEFWSKLAGRARVDGKGEITIPAEWDSISAVLSELADVRNDIAHANHRETLAFIRGAGSDPTTRARTFFNAVVDAIRIVNQGTGYDDRPDPELRAYFEPVKVYE